MEKWQGKIPFQIEETVANLPMEFTREPMRHLIYHLWPNKSNQRWKWNLLNLKKRISLFDGVRAIGVATDDSTVTIEEVADFMSDTPIDYYYHTANDKKIGEGATFPYLMKLLPDDQNSVTFYAHGKACRHDDKSGTAPLIWTDCMYRLLLDDWPRVYESLQKYKVVGAFKNVGQFNLSKHDKYSFDGTFFWFRNSHAFNRRGWTDFPLMFISIESWPSRIFSSEEAGYLLAEYDEDGSWMYKREAWERFAPLLAERGIHLEFAPQSTNA